MQVRTLGSHERDAAYHLLSAVDDPLVVSSFQSLYSSLLGLGARYDDALLRVSEELLITTNLLSA